MKKRITLADLERWREPLNLAWLARQLGVAQQTLYNRLKRGSPETSEEESEAMRKALRSPGFFLEGVWFLV